uniref:Uncharacterized protein n=1 Tax=Onchocerca volvulus TaxID=6282 RepID=A0A8R1XMW7_ONCVO
MRNKGPLIIGVITANEPRCGNHRRSWVARSLLLRSSLLSSLQSTDGIDRMLYRLFSITYDLQKPLAFEKCGVQKFIAEISSIISWIAIIWTTLNDLLYAPDFVSGTKRRSHEVKLQWQFTLNKTVDLQYLAETVAINKNISSTVHRILNLINEEVTLIVLARHKKKAEAEIEFIRNKRWGSSKIEGTLLNFKAEMPKQELSDIQKLNFLLSCFKREPKEQYGDTGNSKKRVARTQACNTGYEKRSVQVKTN